MKKNNTLNATLLILFLVILINPLLAFSQATPLPDTSGKPEEQEIFREDIYQVDSWPPPQTKESDDFQAKFLNMLFILGLLISFMILASWALKRMMKARVTQINQNSLIKLLETRPLSPKSLAYLIEIEGQRILVGESQNGLTCLASFPEKIDLEPIHKV